MIRRVLLIIALVAAAGCVRRVILEPDGDATTDGGTDTGGSEGVPPDAVVNDGIPPDAAVD